MESSRLWHILVVISSIRICIEYFEGTASEDDFARMRLFPNNFDYIGVNDEIEEAMDLVRYHEVEKNTQSVLFFYRELEDRFLKIFYKEIEKGIPLDVKYIPKDDPTLGDIPRLLEHLIS